MTDSPRPPGPYEPGDADGAPPPAPVPPGWSPQQPPPAPSAGTAPGGAGGAGGPGGPVGWERGGQGWGGQGWGGQGWGGAPYGGAPQGGGPYGGAPQGGPGRAPWAPPAPKPGIIPLRPLGVGELLDGAISTLRSHPRTVLGLSALVALVTQLVEVPLSWLLLGDLDLETGAAAGDLGDLGGLGATALVSLVVTLLAATFLTGVLTVVVSRAVLGEDLSLGEAWARARPRLLPLLGLTLLSMLLLGLVLLVPVLPGVLVAATGGDGDVAAGLVLLGLVVGLPLLAWVYVRIALASPAVVLEGSPVVASLRRSARLVQGAWWRTFGVLLLVNLVAGILSGILSVPFSVAAGLTSPDPSDLVPLLVTAVGTVVASAITWPFTAAATVLLYVDRRMRREGLDLELSRAVGR
ncbi:hypothetical protein [Vallicoccus soli]|uniref:DUF7847 domain-containing protein n=1 Tax=Vallicoccus soli TaxID=2339232 RepID=A0A3A3YYN4_9ACTN|nr:hypothetical protein [Vallicoccus soli]RJK95404.1 hypothetical protein D5H78_12150 [Vallicoccus soli]